MEKEQRTALRTAVVKMRRFLEKDFQEQLEGTYSILPDGRVLDSAPGDPVVRARLLGVVQHHLAGGANAPEAVDRVAREAAFTVLNRFAALKMSARRHLVRECVSEGIQSEGIRELAECAPGLRGALEDGGYRLLLDAVMDEISLDLKILFNRRDSMAPLWPCPKALDDLLDTLNDPQLAGVWGEDEAIGWIYQYFNDNDVKEMRDAAKGGAPRNSRELAVRNQFFTPRYVVEFLTDNTLGRLWYEMTGGETVLRECCRYLVRRPTEIFLKPGESAPASAAVGETGAEETPSQEDLLRQPVYIPHRPLKDPRDIRLLDPACGSMHFGLYAFDLFTVIYDEAWEIANGPDNGTKSIETFASFVAFAATFADKAALLREVPRLIVERNIHGIDIDPRAVQIAGLSLWLRAQRAWHQVGVKPADRPRITRSNLVCAERMPGEKELLREFVEQQFPVGEQPAFAFLLEKIFDHMALAGEAGSLLRVEQDIRTTIADAKRLWKEAPKHEQAAMFSGFGEKAGQGQVRPDLSGITDEQFWKRAEERIYDALEAYSEQAEDGSGFQRRLFAADAAQGFAFIDVCRKRYDVVVMNPPFGEASLESRDYLYATIPDSRQDLFAAFVSRGNELLQPGGAVGAITNRLGLTKDTLADWRERVFFGGGGLLRTVADLGYGILDAVVETAAYVIEKHEVATPVTSDCTFFYLLDTDQKESVLQGSLDCAGAHSKHVFRHSLESFAHLPSKRIAYWCSHGWLNRFKTLPSANQRGLVSKKGIETGKDFIMLRLTWEVPQSELIPFKRWTPQSKGGPYHPVHSDIHMCFDWAKRELLRRMSNAELYGHAGATYTERTTSNFAARILPAQALFSTRGPIIARLNEAAPWGLLGFVNSSVVGFYLELFVGGGDASAPGTAARVFASTYLELLPVPGDFDSLLARIAPFVQQAHDLTARFEHEEETSMLFRGIEPFGATIKSFVARRFAAYESAVLKAIDCWGRLDEEVARAYALSGAEIDDLRSYLGRPLSISANIPTQRLPEVERFLTSSEFTPNEDVEDEAVSSRAATKLCYRVDPIYESGSAKFQVSPNALAAIRQKNELVPESLAFEHTTRMLSYVLGSAFGRWDVRYATGERPAPGLPDPFAPLPPCPPGMLQGDDGLPLSPEAGRRLWTNGRYPIDVAWDGILVDDPENPLDLERRVRAALAVLWGDRADALELEACELLGVPNLREWFRRPAGFFADHLKRYSRSRRQAPIYWPLSTSSGSYTIWVYYHRLTADTLFQLAEHVELKLGRTREERLRAAAGQAKSDGRESARLAKQAGELIALELELEDTRSELLRVAELPYKPNLNDGVQITAAPLWRLFRFSKWRKDLETTWKSLEKEEHDWAHLAHAIWPDRVREKCKTDRSLAIAHGLEEFCNVEVAPAKKRRKKRRKKSRK